MTRTALDRRAFLRGAAGVAGALALGACGGGSGRSISLPATTLGPAPQPGSLRPARRPTVRAAGPEVGLPSPFGYTVPPGYFTMAYMYDSLLWTDVRGQLIPWLAATHEPSPDGLTHTFELRDGVRWHDGQPLTAADVQFSFEYFAANRTKISPLLLGVPEHVASVRSTGPRAVEITLDKPAVTFAETVAGMVPIVPRHVWETVSDPGRQDRALLVGSGPYRLESYTEGQGNYAFVANDDFFLGRPFVERLEQRRVADELAALLTGDIDVATTPPGGVAPGALRRFLDDAAYGVTAGPADFGFFLYWNLARGGPLGDVGFRRACAHAIDRDDIVARVGGGVGEPGNPGFLPAGHPYRVEVEQYAHDRERAGDLLDAAGYRRSGGGTRRGADGRPLRFELLTGGVGPAVSELVASALREVGIDARIVPSDFAALAVRDGNFDMAIVAYGGTSGDPDLMRRVYSSRIPPTFRSAKGYANAEVDDLADAQLVALDAAERKELVGRMQRLVAADLPVLALYNPTPVLIYRKAVLDQVAFERGATQGPLNKQALVTGTRAGGTEIRPIAE